MAINCKPDNGEFALGIGVLVVIGIMGIGWISGGSKPEPDVHKQSYVVLNKLSFGCPTTDSLEKVNSMFHADREAAMVIAQRAQCGIYKAGYTGRVSDQSAFADAYCVRQDGSPDCTWFRKDRVDVSN